MPQLSVPLVDAAFCVTPARNRIHPLNHLEMVKTFDRRRNHRNSVPVRNCAAIVVKNKMHEPADQHKIHIQVQE